LVRVREQRARVDAVFGIERDADAGREAPKRWPLMTTGAAMKATALRSRRAAALGGSVPLTKRWSERSSGRVYPAG
jgi:hypothetical protein